MRNQTPHSGQHSFFDREMGKGINDDVLTGHTKGFWVQLLLKKLGCWDMFQDVGGTVQFTDTSARTEQQVAHLINVVLKMIVFIIASSSKKNAQCCETQVINFSASLVAAVVGGGRDIRAAPSRLAHAFASNAKVRKKICVDLNKRVAFL